MQHSFSIALDRRRHAVHALLVALVLFSSLYLLLVGLAFAHAVEREELASLIGDTRTRLSRLEGEYLEATDRITPLLIAERGFVVPADVYFITREPLGRAALLPSDL